MGVTETGSVMRLISFLCVETTTSSVLSAACSRTRGFHTIPTVMPVVSEPSDASEDHSCRFRRGMSGTFSKGETDC